MRNETASKSDLVGIYSDQHGIRTEWPADDDYRRQAAPEKDTRLARRLNRPTEVATISIFKALFRTYFAISFSRRHFSIINNGFLVRMCSKHSQRGKTKTTDFFMRASGST